MKWINRLFLFLLLFVVLPTIATVALLKLTAKPLLNALLQSRVNAPAEVKDVKVNWLLTHLEVDGLEIGNPPGFGSGKLLSADRIVLSAPLKVYWEFKPFLSVDVNNLYFHFIRRGDNATNVAVAFGIPYTSGEVKPLEFELKRVFAKININTLKEVSYWVNGTFEGFSNDADFTIEGKGDFSNPQEPQTVADFVIRNWHIRNNPLLTKLGTILQKPQWKNLTLTRVEGTVSIDGPWIVFVKRNTKAYTVGNVLYAEIYKGSRYNRLTKELDITLAIYVPAKVEVHITGTTDNPKISFKNLNIPNLGIGSGLLPTGGKITNPVKVIKSNATQQVNKIKTQILQKVEKTKEEIQEKVEKTKEQLKEQIENTLKGIIKY